MTSIYQKVFSRDFRSHWDCENWWRFDRDEVCDSVIAKIRGWSDRPPLIQYNRCWEFYHRTARCQAAEPRCRICGDNYLELSHSIQNQTSPTNNMVTDSNNRDSHSNATCIHCKREGRQNTNHLSNWTQCPKQQLWVGINRTSGLSYSKSLVNQPRALPKRTYVPRNTQNIQKAPVEPTTSSTLNTVSFPQVENITDLAKTAGADITNIPEVEICQALTTILMKYKSKPWVVHL